MGGALVSARRLGTVVGFVVLHHLSPRGGTSSDSLTVHRLDKMVRDGVSGQTLFDLMMQVGEQARKEAEEERDRIASTIAYSLTNLNVQIDSARLANYIRTLTPKDEP